MGSLFDYLHDKLAEGATGSIFWNGMFGGVIATATILLFNSAGVLESVMAVGVVFGSLIAKLFAEDAYKWAKKKISASKNKKKKSNENSGSNS